MPSFQRSVLPLPFRRCAVAAVGAARERNCWKRLSVVPLCTSDQNADWLSTNGRTAKIGFNPICYGTAVTAQWQAETAQRNGGTSNVILTALTEFVSTATATAERQNGTLETRHNRSTILVSTSPIK